MAKKMECDLCKKQTKNITAEMFQLRISKYESFVTPARRGTQILDVCVDCADKILLLQRLRGGVAGGKA